MPKEKDYYKEIDKALKEYEEHRPYQMKPISWICDRIDWSWRWRKINREQMKELADRMTEVLKNV